MIGGQEIVRIAILGYSGSGKSTLARKLGEIYGADVLHFDTIHFLPDWKERSREEKERITREFLDTHDSWVIDGNYSKLFYERRMKEADIIILMLFNRFSCLYRVICRYMKYRNTTRPDMCEGCNEKLDGEFVKWVLHDGRTRRKKKHYKDIISEYREKVIVVKNQKQLEDCFRKLSERQKKA